MPCFLQALSKPLLSPCSSAVISSNHFSVPPGVKTSITVAGTVPGIVSDFSVSRINGFKIGKGVLISELSDLRRMTGHAFPLRYMRRKGLLYSKVSLFAVTQDGLISCDRRTGLPYAILDAVVPAGVDPRALAGKLAHDTGYSKDPLRVLRSTPRDEQNTKVSIWSFVVKGKPTTDNAIYRTLRDAKDPPHYPGIINSILRHTEGVGMRNDRWLLMEEV